MAEKGILFDMEKCIACRACQVACKQWNELPAEKTTFFAATGGYQNPIGLSPKTYTLVKFYETETDNKLRWLFRVQRCMHCVDPSCVKACPITPKAMTHVKELGLTYVNKDLCIGCGACHEYCPWNIPQIDDNVGKSTKCTFCVDRVTSGLEPACAKACPTGAITFSDYDKVLKMAQQARKRLKKKGRHPHLYGEKELVTGMHKIYVLPEPIDYYPDLLKNPKVSEDLSFFRQLLKPFAGLALTAAAVGMLIGRVKEVREKQKEKV